MGGGCVGNALGMLGGAGRYGGGLLGHGLWVRGCRRFGRGL